MYHVLHLGLSYACNMRCAHCFVNRQTDSLLFSEIKNAIDVLEKKGLFIVYYTYGEPLLANNLLDVCRYVKGKGMVQILMTNGYLLSESVIPKLAECGISSIYVSLDSSHASKHDANRGKPGAFDAALSAISLCSAHQLQASISTTVTKSNVHELDKIVALGKAYGVRSISFLRERSKNGLLAFSDDESRDYISFFKRTISASGSLNIKFHDPTLLTILSDLFQHGDLSSEAFEKYSVMNQCHACNTVSIAPNGDVQYCNLFGKPIGNLHRTDFIDILQAGGKDTHEHCFCCSSVSQSGK